MRAQRPKVPARAVGVHAATAMYLVRYNTSGLRLARHRTTGPNKGG